MIRALARIAEFGFEYIYITATMPTSKGKRFGSKQSNTGSPSFLLVVLVVALAGVTFHFRANVATFLIPKILKRTTNNKEPLGEFQALGWANSIEKMGTSESVARCCYLANDFSEMHDSWCGPESGLDPLVDAIPVLSECSDNLKGRDEWPIEKFASVHYQGKVKLTQPGRGGPSPTFIVSKIKRRMKKKSKSMPPVTDPLEKKVACDIMEKCARKEHKNEKPCKVIKEMLGSCHK